MITPLTASIVLYNNAATDISAAISSVLNNALVSKLYLIDNSETDALKQLTADKRIKYIFNNKNLGFGNAHNIAIAKSSEASLYHLILNPDVKFASGVIEEVFSFMEKHKNIGQLMPNVYYENGERQKLCNLLPTPADLLGRRFFPGMQWAKNKNERYELKDFGYKKCANIPNLSGCFMFMRNEALKKTGGFDKRFFMYMEDVDLTRRMHKIAETIFYPYTSIIHGYEKESYSNPVLLKHHIYSAIKYFNKWGWLIDKQRTAINNKTLAALRSGETIYEQSE